MSIQSNYRLNVRHLILNSITAVGLGISCITGLLLLNAKLGVQSKLETRLADIAVSEMVGTNTYQKSERPAVHDFLSALMETFGIPLGNPLGMAESAYPTVVPSTPNPSPNKAAQSAPNSGSNNKLNLISPIAKPSVALPSKIVMGWIPSGESGPLPTPTSISYIQNNPGITVVSSPWFQLWSSDGTVKDYVQPGVITYAHQHHIQVWAMVDNQYSKSLADAMLTSKTARVRFVQELVKDAVAAKVDGLNMDFENMYNADRDPYTNLVGTLHQQLAKHHIRLSVDITPDINFLQDVDFYFHAGLAANADYVIVMAYDEHWHSDTTAGPVTDIPWTSTAVTDLLNTGVPADKLILAIPFYTYFWHIASDGSVIVNDTEALPLSEVQSILRNHGATGTWDSHLQLGYARYPKPDGYEEVWYETTKTIQDQIDMINNLGLSGVAVWSLGNSDRHTWSIFTKSLQKSF